VRAVLSVLTRVEREVILLAYFDGYTPSEIAARIAIPLGTVKSRTLRGLRRLRSQLGRGPAQALIGGTPSSAVVSRAAISIVRTFETFA
jgi:DNA-directed RNA polymerase specialized sigma24 family protein